MKNIKLSHVLLAVVLLFMVISRFVVHSANFSLVFAGLIFVTALFGRDSLRFSFQASVLALAVLFATDMILGVYAGISFVYLSYALILVVGYFVNRRNIYSLGSAALVSPMIFFVVSNFGVWFSTGMYAKTFSGLVDCYLSALPFYHNTLISSFFGVALFSAVCAIVERFAVSNEATA